MKFLSSFLLASFFVVAAQANDSNCSAEKMESALLEFYQSTYWGKVTPDTVFEYNIYDVLNSDAGMILRMSLQRHCPNANFHSTKLNQILQKEKQVQVTDQFGLEFETKRLLTIRELTSEINK